MIVQEKVNMDGDHIMRRCNELGLEFGQFSVMQWNPMFALLIYEETDLSKLAKEDIKKKAAAASKK